MKPLEGKVTIVTGAGRPRGMASADRLGRWMRWDVVQSSALRLAAALMAVAASSPSAHASLLQPPAIGGRGSGIAGNVVATPSDGPSILMHNPAGVVGRSGTEVTAALSGMTLTGRYTNSQIGYDQKSSETPFAPVLWVGSDRPSPWYVGAGVYGTVGSSFNFAAEPSVGVPERFLAELGLVQLGLVIGREVVPGLRFGLQAAPAWGRIRTRTPSPLGAVNFDVDGFGISGTIGLLYDLSERTTVAVSYRSPGMVFMNGGGCVGGEGEDVSIDFHTPQSVTFGIAHEFTPRLMAAVQARWTDYPDFENGVFEFERHPELNRKFIGDARSTVRYGIGVEYALAEWLWLRAGFSREEWMMQASALSPLLYDATDSMFSLGLGVAHGGWTIDSNVGFAFMEDRLVTAADQMSFSGRYQLESSPGVSVSVTYRFDTAAARNRAQ